LEIIFMMAMVFQTSSILERKFRQLAKRSQIRYSTTIASLNSSAKIVTAVLSNGTWREFDLVVGADGIHSAVRTVIYPDVQPVYRHWFSLKPRSDSARGRKI